MESISLLFTQYVFLSSEDIVPPNNVIVEYEYSKSFLMSGGRYIEKDMLKLDLSNENFATQNQLE